MKHIVIALTCVLWAVPCSGRIITVDDDGPAHFDNIQAAINDANDGDIIEVNTGTYTGTGNREPAAFAGPDRVVLVGEPVAFFGEGTSPDDEIVQYIWDFESDGMQENCFQG